MARLPVGGSGARLAAAQRLGRRAWPVVLMAWERWQALPEAEKERYRRQARELAGRGRSAASAAAERARRRRG